MNKKDCLIIYQKLEIAIRKQLNMIVVESGLASNNIRNAIRWIMRDNPDIFWFAHQYHFDESSSTISFQYTFSAERVKTIQQSIDDVIENDFDIKYVRNLSQLEQASYVYKWLVTYCNYNPNSAYNQSIYSVFVRRNSVCTGYAKAAQYLFNLLGIESRLVFGRLNNDKEDGRHCWNLVKVDNEYYHFDACFGDNLLDCVAIKSGVQELFKVDGINYNFLCVSTNEVLRTRSVEDITTLPECNTSWTKSLVKDLAQIKLQQREGIKGCLLSNIGSSADIYLCSKDKNTVIKIFRPNSKTTSIEEFHYMQQTKGCQHLLQCNEDYTDISQNMVAIEQSIPIVDLLCSHYYELSLKGLIKMATDIAMAWKECQERGVLYRDIHICNIYRTNDGTFKLGDFGSCANDFGAKGVVGNQWFMAPETISSGVFVEASAVYSISMVMYFILNNLRPAFWQFGREDYALQRRIDGENLPLPIGCSNLPPQINEMLSKFFKKAVNVSTKDRICNLNELEFELKRLVHYCGSNDYIIHRKGISLDFDLDAGNKDRLDTRCNYISRSAYHRYAMCEEVEKSCKTAIYVTTKVYGINTDSNTEKDVHEDFIADYDIDGCADQDNLLVDEVESFACTMACIPDDSSIASMNLEDSEMNSEDDQADWMDAFIIGDDSNNSNNEQASYEPNCIPNNKIEQINHSIAELEYKISEEKRLANEQEKSIRIKINEEARIAKSLENKVKGDRGAIAGAAIGPIILGGIGTVIGSIAGLFVGRETEHEDSTNEEEIRLHQKIIKELNSELIYLQKQSDERISKLQNQLNEHIARWKDIENVSDVYSSVFAPAEIKRKSHLQVQVYLHLYEETEKVKSLAKESDSNAERRDYIPLSLKLRKGDKVDVEFNVYGETRLMSDCKHIIWQGAFTKCSFDYFVSKDIDVDELSCEADIFVNGAMIGEMRFITQIVDTPRNLNPEILSHRFNKIFISYAHQDAQQIKLLALAYKSQGVDYFYDRDSLAPGDVYEEKIFDYIDSSDLFVLCWSKNAAVSNYVAKEKGRALLRAYPQLRQRDATLKICPISIEPRAELPSDMKEVYNFEVI